MTQGAIESPVAALMDRIYRHQRHGYDLTRKYYLLGRDQLIAALDPPAGGSILEFGCGTARNLIAAAEAYPGVTCYGVDISEAMLRTARRQVRKAGLSGRVILAAADASEFDPRQLFGQASFDRVFFSYSLSMIPAWREALDLAAKLTSPSGGRLHVVDFGQQENLPRSFRWLLRRWLAQFHVDPRADLALMLRAIAQRENATFTGRSLQKGYAYYAELAFR